MNEHISRQKAIDAIVNCTNCGTPDELRKYVDKHSLENGWTGGVLDAMGRSRICPPQMLFRWLGARTASFARMMIFAQGEGFPTNLCQMTAFAIRGKKE